MANNKGIMEKELKEFLKEEPHIILDNFMSEKLSLLSLLNVKHQCPQRLIMALELIQKACKPTNDANLVAKFLCHLATCKDYFIMAVSVLVGKELSAAKFIEGNFLETVVSLLHTLVQRIPTVSISILEILLPQLLEICKKYSENEHMFRELENLEKQKEAHIAMTRNTEKSPKPSAAAPFDFRLLSDIPSIEEMFFDEPFLRPAIVDGPYSDVEQYLDIHFRLLREDMFKGFRTCLADFHKKKKMEEGRMYDNAYIDKVEQTNTGTLLYFVVPVRSKVDWKTTKRLVPGSLLCLSCDGFKSIYFGSIHSRKDDGQNANMCYLALSFEPTKEPEYFLNLYTIIETGGYYESYKHVFEKFKSLTSSTFPFGNCLLDYEGCDHVPFPLDSAQELHLKTFQSEINDDNQSKAFELALRNKIALIQGPPGTGKSYLGVQIARFLAQIADIQKPIIIMCYTNHALDQFLEKMLDFTKKVVRIGGQSKCQLLNFHNLGSLTSKQNYDQMRTERFHDYFMMKSHDDDFSPFSIFCDIYGNRKAFVPIYPKHTHYMVKTECEVASKFLNNCLQERKYPFTKTTLDVRLCDINGLHDTLTTKGKLTNAFNMVLHTADKIKLHQWLMTDKSFFSVYDEMLDFKKMLTEELIDYIQLKKILKMEKITNEQQKLGTLAKLLIRLCKHSTNLLFISQNVSPEKIECFIQDFLFADDLVFPLFLRATVRCAEKNLTTVNEQCNNLWLLDINERWNLLSLLLVEISTLSVTEKLCEVPNYIRYVRRYSREDRCCVEDEIEEVFEIKTHKENCKYLKDYQTDKNAHFLQGADIIGITATGAAKNFDLLKKIGATTYIVEEAAEVFESHIVATLVPDMKHLVLIGDHFQLRPTPTVYNLAVKYHLDVSLFERLFKNKVPSACLQVQHRMRPSIARLLVPDFYHSLDNHPSVLEYENIAGMSSNVFFLQHSELENENDELKSHSNSYEVLLIVTLCKYLISQGHDPSSITILTTYVGQLHLIKRNKQNSSAKGVLATTVDNYQGEENDIILISFVRSNIDNNVGFIKTHNRLCVALSRARKGLYCVGNFNMLASQSKVWQSLLIKLQYMGGFGEELVINCCRHPKIENVVKTPFDFQRHMKKGCHEPCNELLHCGHACCLLCHEQDTEHIGNHCNLECKQKIIEQTPPLYDEAETECLNNVDKNNADSLCIENGSCSENFDNENKCPDNLLDITDKSTADSNHKTFAEVNHSLPVKSTVTEDYKNMSNEEADETLAQSDSKLTLDLSKLGQSEKKENTTILSCGHVLELENKLSWRGFDITYDKCKEMIVSQMKCGEHVNHVCGEQANHLNCSSPLLLKCGHKVPCNTSTDSYICQQDLEISLECGHNKLVPCWKSKMVLICNVEVEVNLTCSHPYNMPCFKKNSVSMVKCKQPCGSLLECSHRCVAICSDCSFAREHAMCAALVKRPISCGHILETECSTPFPLCHQRCMSRCDHMQCINPCYVACFPCQKPCTWNCEHYRCDKLCSEICDRPPCDKPCSKSNPSCGHPCSGFCGEPCPTFCQQCNKSASENNDKFILLEDCGHCIPYIELSNFLTKYESQNCPRCPECKAPITKNVRFGNTLKLYYKSRNGIKPKSLVADLPAIQLFQSYVSDFEFTKHAERLWKEFQKENLQDENYFSKLRVARLLHVLFSMKKFQEHLGGDEGNDILMLYTLLKKNKAKNYDTRALIFRIGASLFIQEVISTKNMFSKVGLVNEMCEDVMDCLTTSPFNDETVKVVQERVNSVSHLHCPTLNAFIGFLEELQFAIA